jgi:hypothetical protein
MLQRTGLPAGVVSCRERPPTRGNSPLQTVGSPASLSPANAITSLLFVPEGLPFQRLATRAFISSAFSSHMRANFQ